MKTNDMILILDFGSQYSQLIARRVRELGVYCEIFPFTLANDVIQQFSPKGVILSGGPASVNELNSPRIPELIFKLGVPLLGICYGMQVMAAQLGGVVASGARREFGLASLDILPLLPSQTQNSLFDFPGCEKQLSVWMSHGDHVETLPPGFIATAKSDVEYAAMMDPARHYYGLQFHPEVTHTPQGKEILKQFLFKICRCDVTWRPEKIVSKLLEKIRETVGKEKVILAFSGGVDSSVTATLLHEAIGDQLSCVFIDTGLLRKDEVNQVLHMFREERHFNLTCVSAASIFLKALKGVTEPEEKRKIIGKLFIELFEAEAKKQGDVRWLAQGTIYSDVIESAHAALGQSHVIKSHHNVGGLPEKMHLKLVEPLRELFKDEVRAVGLAMGLPYEWLYRHPFPGVGLAVRVMGEISEPVLEKLREADAIFIEELYAHDLYYQTSQSFAVYLPVHSVGVVGDARHYEPIIALRSVKTDDFMTAHWAHLPYDFLTTVSHRIVNEVKGISRVVYDITGKPPATIEWE